MEKVVKGEDIVKQVRVTDKEKREIKMLSVVSFLMLMEGHDGVIGKAPAYINEKFLLMREPAYMFSALDDFNQARVYAWGERWGIDFRKLVGQMKKDYNDISVEEFRKHYGL